jgi:UDPglucose--hexose-1-phosphate uridylyltransferase
VPNRPGADHHDDHHTDCPLCPGYTHADGSSTPHYTTTLIIDDDDAALLPDIKPGTENREGLLVARSERGICRMVSHSPHHHMTFSGMDTQSIRRVIDAWASQCEKLGRIAWVNHIQVFDDCHASNGRGLSHPHAHIHASERIPARVGSELREQRGYMTANRRSLLRDYLELELDQKQRIVCQNDHFVALVPFWAGWPFETLLLPRAARSALTDLSPDERNSLAAMIRELACRYDRQFWGSVTCSMSVDQRPADGRSHPEWQLHLHFYPPVQHTDELSPCLAAYDLTEATPHFPTPEESACMLRGE